MTARAVASRLAHALSQLRISREAYDSLCERCRICWRNEPARSAVLDDFLQPTDRSCDHGEAGRHRLENRHAESLSEGRLRIDVPPAHHVHYIVAPSMELDNV